MRDLLKGTSTVIMIMAFLFTASLTAGADEDTEISGLKYGAVNSLLKAAGTVFNDGFESGNCNAWSSTVGEVPSQSTPVLGTPSVSANSVTLTWTFDGWPWLSASNEGYRLEESTTSPSSGFTQIQFIPGRDSPESTTLTRSTGTYYYRVRVFLNQGPYLNSPYSNVVSATVSPPGETTISVLPFADNLLMVNSQNSNTENTVYRTNELDAGCNWLYSYVTYIQDYVCAWSALQFDVNSQIAGKTIISATLRLTPRMFAADFNTTYYVAAFASSWSTFSITANNSPNIYISGQTSVNVPTSSLPVDWDVTQIVRNWANGTWANNGFSIGDDNLMFPYTIAYRATAFHSTDVYNSTIQRPLLIITLQ